MEWKALYKARGLTGVILGAIGVVMGMVGGVIIATTYNNSTGNFTGNNAVVFGSAVTFFGLGLMAYSALTWFKSMGS